MLLFGYNLEGQDGCPGPSHETFILSFHKKKPPGVEIVNQAGG